MMVTLGDPPQVLNATAVNLCSVFYCLTGQGLTVLLLFRKYKSKNFKFLSKQSSLEFLGCRPRLAILLNSYVQHDRLNTNIPYIHSIH